MDARPITYDLAHRLARRARDRIALVSLFARADQVVAVASLDQTTRGRGITLHDVIVRHLDAPIPRGPWSRDSGSGSAPHPMPESPAPH